MDHMKRILSSCNQILKPLKHPNFLCRKVLNERCLESQMVERDAHDCGEALQSTRSQAEHVAIEIESLDSMEISMRQKIDSIGIDDPFTMFRVPSHIRESNKTYYEPRMVSIGPYHRESKHLHAMEKQKLRYLRQMLDEQPDVTLKSYLTMLEGLAEQARRCYFDNINLGSREFIEMMLLDGCFIIQHVLNFNFGEPDNLSSVGWNIPLIKTDLLMLENQIPFFVLQRLYNLAYSSSQYSLLFHIVRFLMEKEIEQEDIPVGIESDGAFHLLHVYYCCIMDDGKSTHPETSKAGQSTHPDTHPETSKAPRMIPCARELEEAGVTFKKAESESLFDVSFAKGVLTLPRFPIEEATRPRLLNSILFEQCLSGQEDKTTPLASYAVLMNCIVNKPEDVMILQRCGIIENKLANEQEAAHFLNQLRYGCYLHYDTHYHAGLFADVTEYYESDWRKYRSWFYRRHCRNPWLIISLMVGIVLILLFLLQSFCITLYILETFRTCLGTGTREEQGGYSSFVLPNSD